MPAPPGAHPPRPFVLGLAGGIGSGKSTVARHFAALGCTVFDADRDVAHALERPDVRATLKSWWGPRALRDDGGIDRAAVAQIVFADETQRRRLEALLHPFARRTREQAIREATELNAGLPPPGVIIDAPLLFEAGLDAECDAVAFIDAPEDLRLQRVAAARAWSPEEFHRRQAAQWPVEQKKARSRFTIDNAGDDAALARQVRQVFAILQGDSRPT